MKATKAVIEPALYRTEEAATVLAVSPSQVLLFERAGQLHKIQIPGLRAVRFSAEEVRALAQRWIDASMFPENGESPAAARQRGLDVSGNGGREHHEPYHSARH